jgi:hypothetical protein
MIMNGESVWEEASKHYDKLSVPSSERQDSVL